MQSTESLLATVLPLCLAIVMFGLGLGLTRQDFARVARFPKPVYLGLAVQMLVLPVAAYALCRLFALPADLAIGLMLLAASPGGVTANIFSHLARGDVALNLTLTAINSVLSAITLPVIVGLAFRLFADGEREIGFQFSKAIEVFAIVLVPVGIGMFVHDRFPVVARRADRPFRVFSILLLIALVAGAVLQNRALLGEYLGPLAGVVLAFNVVSLGVGYGLPRVLRLPRSQATAIAMEIGIHNSTLAMALAVSVLGRMSYAMPAALYSIAMFITAGLLAVALSRAGKRAAPRRFNPEETSA